MWQWYCAYRQVPHSLAHTSFDTHLKLTTVRPTAHHPAPTHNSHRVTPNEQYFARPPCFCPLTYDDCLTRHLGVSVIQLYTGTAANICYLPLSNYVIRLFHSNILKNPLTEADCSERSTAICGLGSCTAGSPNPQLEG